MKTLTKELWMEVPQRRGIVSIHEEVERLVEEIGVLLHFGLTKTIVPVFPFVLSASR
jgi:hypothetical protein